ncbi:MAG: hypothetical protein LUD68_01115, partial [Rikenellaceae bacterium]|nr:hypothetical protein [Rikenellaceae bacterium]
SVYNNIIYTYDNDGRLIKTVENQSEATFTYEGNTITKYSENEFPISTTYHLDENGKALYGSSPSPWFENTETRIIFQYDSEDRLIRSYSVSCVDGIEDDVIEEEKIFLWG